jgi:hypothetical protein
MADPLSLAASIIAVLQLTESVLSYISDVRDAGNECDDYCREATNLYRLLTSLRLHVESSRNKESWFGAVSTLATAGGPLKQYKTALESFVEKVGPKRGLPKVTQALM